MQQSRGQTCIHSSVHPMVHALERIREPRLSNTYFPRDKLMLTRSAMQERTRKYGNTWHHTTDFIRFPFNNFKYYLTLFSKFFSSFPHGTCSLSVSCRYLALDGIYHPFRTALPSNSTRWKNVVHSGLPVTNGVFTLHDPAFQLNSTGAAIDNIFYRLQFKLVFDLQIELIPLHSPLLRES